MVLTCLLVTCTHSNQVFCPVDDGGAGDVGNERVRDKRQARELEHSRGEEKEGDRDEREERHTGMAAVSGKYDHGQTNVLHSQW